MAYIMLFTFILTTQCDWISQNRRYMLHNVAMTRSEHEAYCQSQYNTHLASVHCAEEENELIALLSQVQQGQSKDYRGYIGLMVGETQWLDGSSLTYQETLAISGDGSCMELLIHDGITPEWNDLPCEKEYYGLCNYANLDIITNCQFSVIPDQLYRLNKVSASWNTHEKLCLFKFDTHLASIHSSYEQTAAATESNGNHAFIGLNDILIEGEYVWSDGSNWDYGTTYSQYPWSNTQPDNNQDTEDCNQLRDTDSKWNDIPCEYNYFGLCAYPQHIQIINDPSNYIRIPFFNNSIGVMDILDEIYIEFDIVFTSWPVADNWGNILHIGNQHMQRFPAIFIKGNQYFQTGFTTISEDNVVFVSTNASGILSLGVNYHYTLYQTQNSVRITINGNNIYDGYIDSHSIIKDRTLYIGNVWNSYTFDATISNLFIANSNSHFLGFNYNCDATNRWVIISGTWNFDDEACIVRQTDDTFSGAVIWLGTADISSIQWRDYKIEIKYRYLSGDEIGILVRSQTVSPINDGGQQYSFSSSFNYQRVQMSIKNDNHSYITSEPVTINTNIEYILRVEVSGNIFDVYWNNKFIFTVNDSTFTFGSIGLRTFLASAIFTSVRITFPSDNYLYSVSPTQQPSRFPTHLPTTNAPTFLPTINPTFIPTLIPTINPTFIPTISPTINPTFIPTFLPSINPTFIPTFSPTIEPSEYPTIYPSIPPTTYKPTTNIPTTYIPTNFPTTNNPTFGEGGVVDDETTNVFITTGNRMNINDKKTILDSKNVLFVILVVVTVALLVCCICLCLLVMNIKRKKRNLENNTVSSVEMHETMSAENIKPITNGMLSETNTTIDMNMITPMIPITPLQPINTINVTDMGMSMPLPSSSLDLLNKNNNEIKHNKDISEDDDDEDQNLYEQGPQSPGGTESPDGTETLQ